MCIYHACVYLSCVCIYHFPLAELHRDQPEQDQDAATGAVCPRPVLPATYVRVSTYRPRARAYAPQKRRCAYLRCLRVPVPGAALSLAAGSRPALRLPDPAGCVSPAMCSPLFPPPLPPHRPQHLCPCAGQPHPTLLLQRPRGGFGRGRSLRLCGQPAQFGSAEEPPAPPGHSLAAKPWTCVPRVSPPCAGSDPRTGPTGCPIHVPRLVPSQNNPVGLVRARGGAVAAAPWAGLGEGTVPPRPPALGSGREEPGGCWAGGKLLEGQRIPPGTPCAALPRPPGTAGSPLQRQSGAGAGRLPCTCPRMGTGEEQEPP